MTKNRGRDRSRVSSQRHEIGYAVSKVGRRNGANRMRKAKEALARKTGRKAVMSRARKLDSAPAVYSIDEASTEAAFAVIVLAFVSDPAARWTWPQPEDYLRNMPLAARAFGGKSFALGTAFGIDRSAGAALWLPPGVSADEESLAGLIERTAPAAIQQDAASVFERMASFHPREPHWYLPLIGVDPARQGQRLGDRLMAHALAVCDAEQLPAYLESSNPRNLPFYRRHGFEVLGKIQVGSSPTIVPMLRGPRAPR